MAEKILYIIRHPAEAEKIGRAGQRAAEKFTWQVSVKQLEKVVEKAKLNQDRQHSLIRA